MKVLFATTNPAKVKRYVKKLEDKGIEVLTLKDLQLNLKVEENGKNAIENAYLKAKAYYEVQPGTHVRRVNGKEFKQYTWSKGHFYFVDKPSEKRIPGYPLDSISIMPEYNKYFLELAQEEKNRNINNENDVIEFIVKSLV